ncbi:S-layer homology domain-containing protein [Paenibacillus hamazuiensis]|uniref:S-layer homology domain-containing protein n=1 Tax=Paenibacillus hamazuiensis TaxID=2936508 RepID=UPI00200EDD6B|nr:S-layer homology domain-containing protein [Paenibacillus hamazuiensis]
MKNSWMKKAVVSSLALTMALGGTTAAFADGKGKGRDKDRDDKFEYKFDNKKNSLALKLTFDDIQGKDVEWALRYIASLASKQVFEGYEDGTFKPRQTISRIEAITAAVRLMGLREQAESAAEMNSQLNFKDADKIKSKYPWAVGYVAVALENDLFAESDSEVQPDKPADRLWATTLLVKALKLQNEAKAKMNTTLSFKDADKIPAGSVGYVALAIERKLIDGYEDNTFRPNQPVTRAELAALLDRTGTQLPGSGNSFNVTGTVASAVSGSTLSITKDGQTQQLTIDPNAFIFRGGIKVNPGDLKVGDEVRLNLYDGRVVFVEVTEQADQNAEITVSGTLNSYTLNSSGKIATVSINQTVNDTVRTDVYNTASNFTINGDLSLLTNGRAIDLKISNQLVTNIIIK